MLRSHRLPSVLSVAIVATALLLLTLALARPWARSTPPAMGNGWSYAGRAASLPRGCGACHLRQP